MKFKILSLAIVSISLFVSSKSAAQGTYQPSEERSSFERQKKSIMDGNLLRATYHNSGHTGRKDASSLDELLFEFPRNTDRNYMYFMSVMYGTQVQDQNTGANFAMVDVAAYRSSRDGRQSYTINPIVGYVRDDSPSIARSDRGPSSPLGNTWPNIWPDKLVDGGDGWAGSWNGFFGRDQFNADVEFYYKAGDDLYTRYLERYKPDATDLSRGGLGIILDARILAWSQTLVNSTHFNIFEIRNDASYDYERMAFGLWIADFVAGGGPTNRPVFDNLRSIAYLTDTDRTRGGNVFDGGLIGEMGLKFLETPGNAIDGIDNDADSDSYDPTDALFYDPDNVDLYSLLTIDGGGFYTPEFLRDTVIKRFTIDDFADRVLNEGDKIVLIQPDDSRVVTTYPAGGGTVISQGRDIVLPAGGITLSEDLYPTTDPRFGVHIDGLDNDLDGLIDENRPNHLTKTTFINNASQQRAVRHINYLSFAAGDTLQRGLIVPNGVIRSRISTDSDFEELVNDFYEGRFQNYQTSAPMIDEARDDFFDNDKDWLASIDDVGIEGNPDSFSEGQGDGKPSSGAGTTFPGEPNIDKTDVSESDLIGVTRVRIFDAGSLNTNLDDDIWFNYLIPGDFVTTVGTDSDIFVSSGLFPLRKGASERFAVAITAVQTNSPTAQGDRDQTNRNLDQATLAYESDYQFATAPRPPRVRAVPGDGKVTIYWDNSSEDTFDRFVSRLTGNGNDFEGYKLYRSTEVSFEDIFNISDAFGTPQSFTPLAIFDNANGISGLHPVPINGVQFNLGNDSGLQRVFVDENVINGRKYFYAVTAFDFGLTNEGIAPSESPIQINRNPDGSVIFGQNVVEVRPTRSAAGYINPETPNATLVQGSPGGTVSIDLIDPMELLADNLYQVVFEDTLIDGGSNVDTLRTLNFSLINATAGRGDTLISRSTALNGENNPIVEGFTLNLTNIERLQFDQSRSRWEAASDTTPHNFQFITQGNPKVGDYEVIIGNNVGFGQSIERSIQVTPTFSLVFPAMATNFRVVNTYTNEEVDYVFVDQNRPGNTTPAACRENGAGVPSNYSQPQNGELSAIAGSLGNCTDVIYLIEDFRGQQDTETYRFQFNPQISNGLYTTRHPKAGDTLKVFTTKPFTRNDRFEFRMDPENLPRLDADSARNALADILVIPNPYVVSNIYEGAITQTNRQQNRELHFTGIPSPSTLRIFTSSGVMIREIEITQNDLTSDLGGTYIWNMLTKDNLEISYGIYIYHIEATGVGERTGKFAVIK